MNSNSDERRISKEEMSALISACRKNNRVAQIKLYDLYSKSMYNTCLRIVKDSMLAEDIVQECFLTAFQSIGSFRGDSSFFSWLRKIVINRSLDQIRKRKKFFEQIDEESDNYSDEIVDQKKDDVDEFDQERLALLKKLILELPEGFRIIISLYFFEGYDHEEIAQILDITPSTSRSQLTRAKRKLLKMYKEQTSST
ncbi:MAG: RNA polymerase sigma factor [Bacteroidales bacterium]|nr:RNA polymerase sigma factor [Bacteroidales bacterium]